MRVYVCISPCVSGYVCVIYVYACLNKCVYVCLSVCLCVYVCISVHVYAYMCLCDVCNCVCTSVYMCVCLCVWGRQTHTASTPGPRTRTRRPFSSEPQAAERPQDHEPGQRRAGGPSQCRRAALRRRLAAARGSRTQGPGGRQAPLVHTKWADFSFPAASGWNVYF